MDNERVFISRQDEVLLIANSPIGRFLLGAKEKLPIVKVGHSDVIYDTGERIKNKYGEIVPVYKGMFYSGRNNNASSILPILTKLDIIRSEIPQYMPVGKPEFIKAVEHYSGYVRSSHLPQVFLDSGTFTAATGGTGGIYGDDTTYSTARGQASADAADNRCGNEIVGGNYDVFRWFCPTDFTSIVAGSDVTAATGYVWGTTSQVAWLDDTMKFILTTQASTSSLALADYDNLTLDSPTTYGTTGAYTTLDTSAYSSVTMDAGFLTLVESGAGGFIKMGLRASADIAATTPTGTSNLAMSVADNQRTKFDITWTPPATSGFLAIL